MTKLSDIPLAIRAKVMQAIRSDVDPEKWRIAFESLGFEVEDLFRLTDEDVHKINTKLRELETT